MEVLTITKDNFEAEVVKSDKPVLVDFWAEWCGPCRMQLPIVHELAEELSEDEAKVGKINVDEQPELARKFMVMSIPTIIVFKGGEVYKKAVGVQQKEQLKEMLK